MSFRRFACLISSRRDFIFSTSWVLAGGPKRSGATIEEAISVEAGRLGWRYFFQSVNPPRAINRIELATRMKRGGRKRLIFFQRERIFSSMCKRGIEMDWRYSFKILPFDLISLPISFFWLKKSGFLMAPDL